MVIARIWRGETLKSKRAEYLRYLKETGVKDYRSTPGNVGVSILVRDGGERTEFVIISLWESMESIKEFAGRDIEKARYYPKDREFLVELEPKVMHYDLALSEP